MISLTSRPSLFTLPKEATPPDFVRALASASLPAEPSVRSVLIGVMCLSAMSTTDVAVSAITPEEVYTQAKQSGRIQDVEIAGKLDLARLKSPLGIARIEFTRAKFQDVISHGVVGAALRFNDCDIKSIDIDETSFLKTVEFKGGSIRDLAFFKSTTFEGPVLFIGVIFRGKTTFSGSTFEQSAEFIDTYFLSSPGLGAGTRFSNTKFKSSVRFDGSHADNITFDSAFFAGDASFLRFAARGKASFRNVIFQRDAEFRFCKFGRADFGDNDQMSAFHGFADFRGCEMAGAIFDYAEFRGTTTFVNTKIGVGGLSFKNASFRGDNTDFTGLRVTGALWLDQVHFSKLRFRWSDLGAAVMRASPDANALSALHRNLEEFKLIEEANQVYGYLETERMREQVASDEINWVDKMWKRGEWLIWGLPTGYGTRLGRIVLIAMVSWLLLGAPFARQSVLVPLDSKNALSSIDVAHRRPFDNVLQSYPTTYSQSTLQRLTKAYIYTFTLMFKTPPKKYCLGEEAGIGYERFARGVWLFGSVLLAMMALTLAKTSPALQALFGKIAW